MFLSERILITLNSDNLIVSFWINSIFQTKNKFISKDIHNIKTNSKELKLNSAHKIT